MNNSTGVIGFVKRRQLSCALGGKPVDAKTPHSLKPDTDLYHPNMPKLVGYAHYPRPIEKPYANKLDKTSEISTHIYVPKQNRALEMFAKNPVSVTPMSHNHNKDSKNNDWNVLSSKIKDSKNKKYFLYEALRQPGHV